MTRRGLEIALGLLWLLDAGLQLQPGMFQRGFFDDLFDMANMGLPAPVGVIIERTAEIVTAHVGVWNGLFSGLRLLLAVGLLRLHDLVPGGAHTYARGEDQYPEGMAWCAEEPPIGGGSAQPPRRDRHPGGGRPGARPRMRT